MNQKFVIYDKAGKTTALVGVQQGDDYRDRIVIAHTQGTLSLTETEADTLRDALDEILGPVRTGDVQANLKRRGQ